MSEIFRLSGLGKTFAARPALKSAQSPALKGVDLVVCAGEFVGLIGPSGSGKSTLLRTLNGLVALDSGRLEVFGSPLPPRSGPALRRVRRRIGFVFQQFNLLGRLSLQTNVLIGALGRLPLWRSLFGLWPAAERAAALAALERVGVGEHALQRANTLSGGQQQRGVIARALLQGAEVLLADEPVSSLDPASSRKVMEILQTLNGRDGLTVLVSLHQVDHALRYCSRIVALKAGSIVYDGPPQALSRERLADIYGEELVEALTAPQPPSTPT